MVHYKLTADFSTFNLEQLKDSEAQLQAELAILWASRKGLRGKPPKAFSTAVNNKEKEVELCRSAIHAFTASGSGGRGQQVATVDAGKRKRTEVDYRGLNGGVERGTVKGGKKHSRSREGESEEGGSSSEGGSEEGESSEEEGNASTSRSSSSEADEDEEDEDESEDDDAEVS